jgi:hypothetical protein
MIFLVSASQVARIKGVIHWCPVWTRVLNYCTHTRRRRGRRRKGKRKAINHILRKKTVLLAVNIVIYVENSNESTN